MIYIYGLYSEDINNIRYVGKTIHIEKRLKEHINDAKRNNKTYRQNWIRSEIKNNKTINIKILEECDDSNWEEKEKHWIKKYDNLTNLTEGGECGMISKYNISYEDAKKIVQKLNIKSGNQWEKFIKNNPINNIPSSPFEHFKNNGEWISWGDFLGTNYTQDNLKTLNYISYDDAKKWIKNNLIVDTIEDWKKLKKQNKIPNFIPNRPDRYYNNKNRGWISWGDFLSTGRVAHINKNFIPYEDAKNIIINLNIKSKSDWNKKYNTNIMKYNIPKSPSYYYKNIGWTTWGDFLGTGKQQDNLKILNYLSYDDAKKWVYENSNVKSYNSWKLLVRENKIPQIIPNHPEIYYYKKNRGWKGWKDFLGTDIINGNNKKFISYNDAKILLNELNIKTVKEYHKNIMGGNIYNLPKNPYQYYKKTKEWINWNDYLSKENP